MDRPAAEHDIITPEECAELLRMMVSWIYEKTRPRQRNPLPCYRPGRYLRFSRAAVLEWLESTASPQKGGKKSGKKIQARPRHQK